MPSKQAKAEKIAAFKAWLVDHGGYIHPDVDFKPGASIQLPEDRRSRRHAPLVTDS